MTSAELGIESKPWGVRIAKAVALTAGAVGAAGVAVVGADGYAGYKRWPSTETELIGIDSEATHAMLTFSGLGILGGAEQSEQIQRIVGADTAAYWKYSTSRFSVKELADKLGRKAPLLEEMDLNGHSMGGPVGLEVARLRGIKLGHLFFHCSPFDIRDTSFAQASRAAEVFRWPVGPGTKFAFSYLRGMLEKLPPQERRERALFDATNGCSPRIWPPKLRTLRRINLAAHTADYKELIGPNTRVDYFMPEDETLDATVLTRQASERYGNFFNGELGVPFRVHKVPGAGHADVQKAVDYYLVNNVSK